MIDSGAPIPVPLAVHGLVVNRIGITSRNSKNGDLEGSTGVNVNNIQSYQIKRLSKDE